MAHPEQQFFVGGVKQFLPEFFADRRVLEIGSLNINGSVRDLFDRCDYTGLDVGEGRDVDVVCFGENYGEAADSFDVVISCEAMEHNAAWRKTWLNMVRLVKPGGLMVMSCASTGRMQHGTELSKPEDSPLTLQKGQSYYRNLEAEDFTAILPCDAWFSPWYFGADRRIQDLYFFGLANGADAQTVSRAQQLRAALEDHYFKKNVLGIP